VGAGAGDPETPDQYTGGPLIPCCKRCAPRSLLGHGAGLVRPEPDSDGGGGPQWTPECEPNCPIPYVRIFFLGGVLRSILVPFTLNDMPRAVRRGQGRRADGDSSDRKCKSVTFCAVGCQSGTSSVGCRDTPPQLSFRAPAIVLHALETRYACCERHQLLLLDLAVGVWIAPVAS
jgi:hypothetical protein